MTAAYPPVRSFPSSSPFPLHSLILNVKRILLEFGDVCCLFFLQVSCLRKSIFMSESSTELSMFILATDWFENIEKYCILWVTKGKGVESSEILAAVFAGIRTKLR